MDDIDLILPGRKTYELFVDFWLRATSDAGVITDKLNRTAKAIVSNTLTIANWGNWPGPVLIKGNIITEIRKIKEAAGKNIVLSGSIALAQSLMEENLIDEYHFRICPVALGAGKPFFPRTGHCKNLQLTAFKNYEPGLVLLEYQS